jgi:homoserine dehydrogenase
VKRVHLVQIGVGLIGSTVLEQVAAHRATWRERLGVDVGVSAVVGSSAAILAPGGGFIDEHLATIVASRRAGQSLDQLAGRLGLTVAERHRAVSTDVVGSETVVVDTAAGPETTPLLGAALTNGAGVVAANKAPFALPTGHSCGDALWEHSGTGGRVRYEATCGAGLPVISTLRTLLDTGDEVTEITGTVSGTFGAIFSSVATGSAFSAAVAEAKAAGYTEPDPRDDLSGLDVARKALILARTIGRRVDLDEVEVESLVPSALAEVHVDTFMTQIGEADADIAARSAAARADGKTLKYVATVRPDGPIRVGLEAVDTSRVLGALQGPENIVSITTRRYARYPLAVTGPGAGADVTAAGVVADILALALT